MIFRWQTPKIACTFNVHLALKALENFLCAGEHLPAGKEKLPDESSCHGH